MADPADDRRISYRIGADADEVERERARLHTLAGYRDPQTTRLLADVVEEGWSCCDVGAGAGTVAAWLAEQVGHSGRVVAIDVDTRFMPSDVRPPMEVRRSDVTVEPIGEAEFDLVHARAVLQHLHQREAVLDAMVTAARPGGWIVVTDTDWVQFDAQPLPEPFATLHRLVRAAGERQYGYAANWGRRLLGAFVARGLTDVRADAVASSMHGGTDSAEWYVAALARVVDGYRAEGALPAGFPSDFPADEAIAQARRPDFAVLSPISITVRGRRRTS